MSVSLEKIYPYLADQIVEDYGITSGVCLDIGAGPGQIGIEIAKITDLEVYLVDVDPEAIKKSRQKVKQQKLENRVAAVESDVENLQFPDGFADLIVSRGSIWFWNNRAAGLKEIYRVLKKDGIAFIGGGLGRKLPSEYRVPLMIEREKKKKDPQWMYIRSKKYFEKLLTDAGVDTCKLIFDPPAGRWVEIRKQTA